MAGEEAASLQNGDCNRDYEGGFNWFNETVPIYSAWKNDSGFWIVARMGVLTETETLKSWTVISATCGITSFLFVLLFSKLLPLVS